jgi:hypothetical protein
MYWSGCQSTGADMRKYFTATVSGTVTGGGSSVETNARRHPKQVSETYSYQPAVKRRCCLEAGFAVRPGLIRRSQARQIVTEAAAWPHGHWSTCCAATRSPVFSCFAVGNVRRGWESSNDGTRRIRLSKRSCQWEIM